MKCLGLLVALLAAFGVNAQIGQPPANSKVLCYFDGSATQRDGNGKVTLADIETALPFCTHLVYGFAGINAANNKLVSLNENTDLDTGRGQFRQVTSLKRKFPSLRILLSVGGNYDNADKEKYLTLLENSVGRLAFINSAYTLVKTYGFDGIDLAWQFPPNRPKKIRSTLGSIWSKLKTTVGAGKGPIDEKSDEHREEFTMLIRELKNAFRPEGFNVGLTVLPNVNSSLFFDVPALINNIDYVNLAAFDVQTPDRNPKQADFPAPVYEGNEREPESNINAQVTYWLTQNAPASKINVGIPTYGRAWKLTSDSGITGVPPIPETDGPGAQGSQTKIPGLLSWPEVCAKLPTPNNAHLKGDLAPLRKVGDPTKRFGSYAFLIPDGDGNNGVWVGYEDPDTAGNKAVYVRSKGLGGIAIFDLTLDDFRGSCSGDKFPILRAAKYRL